MTQIDTSVMCLTVTCYN